MFVRFFFFFLSITARFRKSRIMRVHEIVLFCTFFVFLTVTSEEMNDNIRKLKRALRLTVKKTLDSMTAEDVTSQSNYIVDKVLNHPKYLAAQRIGIYINLPKEVETKRILKHIFEARKSCFVPRYKSNNNNMSMIKINNLNEIDTFPKTKDKISQPSDDYPSEEALDGGGLELLILPGLAFTKNGYRLGRGRGLYDRYIDLHRRILESYSFPYTIGLAFAQQIFDEVPLEETDKKLDEVIYDDRNTRVSKTE